MYSDQMDQVRMDAAPVTGLGLAFGAAAKLGAIAPGNQPIEVRGVGFVVTTACTVTAPIIGLFKRPTAGSDAARVLLRSVTALLAKWDTAGKVVYADIEGTSAIDATINPGQDVLAEVITPPTAGAGFAVLMYQTKWQQPANNTFMSKSTT